jgi:hypothetical protein
MNTRTANAWIRAHGGGAQHVDMYCRLVNTLCYRLFDYLPDVPADVARLDDVRDLPRRR